MSVDSAAPPGSGRDFIRQIIDRDLEQGRYPGGIVTRFPPEPNGFLHIGHAKAILLNFGIALEYGGRCHLRFDDTNPITEEREYARAIQEDVRWLGVDWGEHLYHAADYFERMYDYAEALIRKGSAYVDSQTEEEIREGRGTVTDPGTPSPHRGRSAEESLELFRRMRAGEFPDGAHVLRARIDMSSPNMLMRDPILYRIRHASHYRTGDTWCIYPLYDYAHCLEDALEGVTHSLCTLEFANNRDLYDWILDEVGISEPRPHQYEFARGELDYTITSKRKLLQLVREGQVEGWDDPRMPTIAALRRRGVPSEAIRAFWNMVGVARADSRVDIAKLEYAIRDELNRRAPRVLAVLHPLKVTLVGWPEGEVEHIGAPYFPRDVPLEGSRPLPLSGVIYIDRDDFSEDPPPGFRRLVPGGEVRLRHAYVIRCEDVVRDRTGRVVELRCSYRPRHDGASSVKGTIQWVSAATAVSCEVRLYDRLFTAPDPDAEAVARGEEASFRDFLNPGSLQVVEEALVEPSILSDPEDTRYQFERIGYFWRDPLDGRGERLVFNRIVTLRDTWARSNLEVGSSVDARSTQSKAGEPPPSKTGAAAPSEASRADDSRTRAEPDPALVARAGELRRRFGLGEVDAEILAREPRTTEFFRSAVAEHAARPGGGGGGPAVLANWIINVLPPVIGDRPLDEVPFRPADFAALVALVESGVVSGGAGTAILEVMARDGGDPRELMERLDLRQVSDADALAPLVEAIVGEFPDKVREYRDGKTGLVGFFIGNVMRRSGGKADPRVVRELLERALK